MAAATSPRTAFITGGSRGIGKAIALRLARAGWNVAIAAKTAEAHPKLEGTIYTAAEAVNAAGGNALPLQLDIRDEAAVQAAFAKTAQTFGGIDVLINNASAINLSPAESIEPKRFDLMQSINVRGTFFTCQACIPHLKKSSNAHILNLSPPLNLSPKWFGRHLPYTLSKYGMSMIVLGLAEELKKDGISVNALWPRTTIATAAVQNLLGGNAIMQRSRKPQIVADAAFAIFNNPPKSITGQFLFDEDVLRETGITDFTPYAVDATQPLLTDIFID